MYLAFLEIEITFPVVCAFVEQLNITEAEGCRADNQSCTQVATAYSKLHVPEVNNVSHTHNNMLSKTIF